MVSKNGNFCLSVPVKGDGTIDSDERKIVEEIGKWMQVNSESIYDTRPWKIFGEGPAIENAAPLTAQGFNEGKGKAFGAEDIRFVIKSEILYATFFAWPESRRVVIKNLSKEKYKAITKAQLLGASDSLSFNYTDEGLVIELPDTKPELSYANVLKLS